MLCLLLNTIIEGAIPSLVSAKERNVGLEIKFLFAKNSLIEHYSSLNLSFYYKSSKYSLIITLLRTSFYSHFFKSKGIKEESDVTAEILESEPPDLYQFHSSFKVIHRYFAS